MAQDPSDTVAIDLKGRIVAEYLKRGDELLAKGQPDLRAPSSNAPSR